MEIYFIVLILASACVFEICSLDYNDLEILGINCPSMVSCNNINSNFSQRNCECDRECVVFNDCCIDARTRVSSRIRRNTPLACMPFGEEPNLGAYALQTCSRSFTGFAEVQRKCQNQNNISDPLMAAPVTDISTRITYRNRYCAECNNVLESNILTWLIRMDCDFTFMYNVSNNFIWENIAYRPDLNKWGVDIDQTFHSCDLLFDKPDYIQDSIRLCRANLITTCPRSWNRTMVRDDCESYTAIMYTSQNRVYRNPHCALCNGLGVDEFSCDRGISSRKKKPFSFALLLDVNRSDGDVVGVSRPQVGNCRANQKYDPYFKKCRDLVCALPGYKRVNGKCVKP